MCAREVVIVRSGGSVRSSVTDRSSAMSRSVYQRPVSHHAVVTADTDDAHRMGERAEPRDELCHIAVRARRAKSYANELRSRSCESRPRTHRARFPVATDWTTCSVLLSWLIIRPYWPDFCGSSSRSSTRM